MTDARRFRFQIHLSTAIVLMLSAGELMWANFRPWVDTLRDDSVDYAQEETSEFLPGDPIFLRYGWPYEAASSLIGTRMVAGMDANFPVGAPRQLSETLYSIPCPLRFKNGSVALNAMIALSVLAVVGTICEARNFLMRRERLASV